MIIIDDNPNNYNLNPDNGLHIKPFYGNKND